MSTSSSSSPYDQQIESALVEWDDGSVVVVKLEGGGGGGAGGAGGGWSEREKELLRRLKGKEREIGELMVSSVSLSLFAHSET